jgi:hypothetical protein
MEIPVPQQVEEQLQDGERIVGYMTNLFNERIFFTKQGCSTQGGCANYVFHEGKDDFSRIDWNNIKASSFTKHELSFIVAFNWN